MQSSTRIQENIVAHQERRFLNWACSHMPDAITSDHLTLVGIAGSVMVPCGYAASWIDRRFLFLSILGFVVNWFGDSLDGSLARYRKLTRPRFGYFMDHSVDAMSILLMTGGMGLSPYVRLDVALFAVAGYLALCIHVFLKNLLTANFQLTFIALGPTELRMIFIAQTLFMFIFGPSHWTGLQALSDNDIMLLITGIVFVIIFAHSTLATTLHLRNAEKGL